MDEFSFCVSEYGTTKITVSTISLHNTRDAAHYYTYGMLGLDKGVTSSYIRVPRLVSLFRVRDELGFMVSLCGL